MLHLTNSFLLCMGLLVFVESQRNWSSHLSLQEEMNYFLLQQEKSTSKPQAEAQLLSGSPRSLPHYSPWTNKSFVVSAAQGFWILRAEPGKRLQGWQVKWPPSLVWILTWSLCGLAWYFLSTGGWCPKWPLALQPLFSPKQATPLLFQSAEGQSPQPSAALRGDEEDWGWSTPRYLCVSQKDWEWGLRFEDCPREPGGPVPPPSLKDSPLSCSDWEAESFQRLFWLRRNKGWKCSAGHSEGDGAAGGVRAGTRGAHSAHWARLLGSPLYSLEITLQTSFSLTYHFANKGPYSQSYGFSSSHVQIWDLNPKESWAPKNWCFQAVVLEETLESPLDSKEIELVNPKGNQPWIFTGKTGAEAPILWPPDRKSWLIGKDPDAGKDWGQEEKWVTEDEMVGWHHWLSGHEFEQTPGDGERQGSLAHCSLWGRKELDTP